MAQQITVNQKGGNLIVRSDASGHIDLNSANTAVAANLANETVTTLEIREIAWSGSGVSGATWTLARGANTVFACRGQNGTLSFENGLKLEQNSLEETANVVFTLSGTGDMVLRLKKRSGE